MTDPADKPRTTPQPGQPAADGNLGGMLSTADRGLADALQRSSERGDDTATGLAATGNASAGGQAPRSDLGGKNEPGSVPGGGGGGDAAAPRAEGPLESFGRAITEVVTGTVDDRIEPLAPIAPDLPKTPGTRR